METHVMSETALRRVRSPTRVTLVDADAALAEVSQQLLERADPGLAVETIPPGDAAERLRAGGADCVVCAREVRDAGPRELFEATRAGEPWRPFVLVGWPPAGQVRDPLLAEPATAYVRRTVEEAWHETVARRVRSLL